MNLVSPKNQKEFDNLRSLLRDSTPNWGRVAISGFRSEENKNDWVASGRKLNYSVNWYAGEPNNFDGVENCIGNLKNT